MINITKLYCGLSGPSDRLRYHRDPGLGPVVAYNCTRGCNLRCQHCYSSSDHTPGQKELTTEQSKTLLTQLKTFGCPVVLFSGGEPLYRPDIMELLCHCLKIGLRAVLSTNGTLIDKRTAERLAEYKVGYVGISIDGPETFHNSFRATEGAYQRAIDGLRICREAGLKTGLRFTMTRDNIEHVPWVFNLAAEHKVRRICFYHLVRTGRAKIGPDACPSLIQIRNAMDQLLERTKSGVEAGLLDEVLTVDNHADGPYLLMRMQREQNPALGDAKELLQLAGGSRVGIGIACIGWDGSVYADQFWRNYSLGNVLEHPFEQIWTGQKDSVLSKIRDKEHHAHIRCKQCAWFLLCKGNYRFLGTACASEHWQNEPPCYLTDEEIEKKYAVS